MEDLASLIYLIQNSKFKTSGLLNVLLEPGSQLRRLYDVLAANPSPTQTELRALMPEAVKNPAVLHTLKSRLKDRLLDATLFLDLDESSFADRQSAFMECAKKWSIAIVLMSKNSRSSAIHLLENLLRHTIRFEFTEITINILRTLRLYYGTILGNPVRFDEMGAQIKIFESIWLAECKVEGLYADMIVRFVRSKSDKEAIQAKANEYFAEAKPLLDTYTTYKVQFFGRLIEIMIHDSRNNYQEVAALCDEAIVFFEQKDYQSAGALQVFYYYLLLCSLNLRQYEKCQSLANKHQGLYEEGTFNWFKLYELYFLVAMHAGNYEDAANICHDITRHTEFESQPAPITELWKIFEAYIHFLDLAGAAAVRKSPDKFKVAKFVNEIQVFSKDKKGMNIPMLVIQFLFTLAEGKHEQLTDKVEMLVKYRMRYLDHSAVRSNYFFRMLEQIPKSGFDHREATRKAGKYLEKLQSVPLEAANQNHEIEILPYEVLWNIAMTVLAKKKAPGASKAFQNNPYTRLH
jgi:hypothetical protein